MQIDEFAKEYANKSDQELLLLASGPSQLTDDANQALSAELRKRGMATEEIESFKQAENQRKQKEENDIGRLWLNTRYGIGRQRFCKGNYSFDLASETEEFTTTVFILILFLPLIPVGTFRVRRNKKSLARRLRGIQKLPLDWGQVMQVWLVIMFGILVVMVALKFFTSRY
jgi:hypothetical protein